MNAKPDQLPEVTLELRYDGRYVETIILPTSLIFDTNGLLTQGCEIILPRPGHAGHGYHVRRIYVEAESFYGELAQPGGGDRVRIRDGWADAGREGGHLGPDVHVGGQWWTPVVWDDEEDPDHHKTAGLEWIEKGVAR